MGCERSVYRRLMWKQSIMSKVVSPPLLVTPLITTYWKIFFKCFSFLHALLMHFNWIGQWFFSRKRIPSLVYQHSPHRAHLSRSEAKTEVTQPRKSTVLWVPDGSQALEHSIHSGRVACGCCRRSLLALYSRWMPTPVGRVDWALQRQRKVVWHYNWRAGRENDKEWLERQCTRVCPREYVEIRWRKGQP